ncbi:hypothetical protein GCM10007978_37370 [Shewanella hanedai]|nr:hypothetical protein GCM10007978_37370 [Shewanella hanedai]
MIMLAPKLAQSKTNIDFSDSELNMDEASIKKILLIYLVIPVARKTHSKQGRKEQNCVSRGLLGTCYTDWS